MDKNDSRYQTYLNLINKELAPAMGCTEPITIALCRAIERKQLGYLLDRIEIEAGSNIIKNVKSAVVPNSGGRCRIEAAACIGTLVGNQDNGLEGIAHIPPEINDLKLDKYLKKACITIRNSGGFIPLDISVRVFKGWKRRR